MKKIVLALIIFLQIPSLFSQNIIVNDSSQYGFRLALLNNNTPFVLWGKAGANSKVYGAKLIGTSFTTPVQIVPDSMKPRVGSFDGPNLASFKDSIYVVWGNNNAANHHIFLNRSIDAGNSFGPATQADTVTLGDNIEYPGISVSNDGTLGIYFIKSTSTWTNPRQSLITSYDRGNSFSNDSVINTFAPGVPCECCQGNMEMQDSNWVFYYRNNVSNVRNAYNLVSSNYGSTFNNPYELDIVDWNTNTCPSSGPEGHLNGNKSFTAWMSNGSGNMRILHSTVDMSLSSISPAAFIDASVAPNVSQNYPSVDGSDDTIAVVWQDNRYLLSHIFASISTDGGQSFTNSILLSDTSVTASFIAPDVAYANGLFHFVWTSNNKVIYKSASLFNLLSVENNSSSKYNLRVYPNPTSTQLNIETFLKIKEITIVDIMGKTIGMNLPLSNTIDVSNLSTGVYFLKVTGKKETLIQKFVKQ